MSNLDQAYTKLDDIRRNWLFYKTHYELIQSLLLDLEHDRILNRLSDKENELLDDWLRHWTECHFPDPSIPSKEFTNNSDQNSLFWSLFEEQLDERLSACSFDENNPEKYFQPSISSLNERNVYLLNQCLDLSNKLFHSINSTFPMFTQLFDFRENSVPSFMRTLESTLHTESHTISKQIDRLDAVARISLLKPSNKATKLSEEYSELLECRDKLKEDLACLEAKLAVYSDMETQFIELANHLADCQGQIQLAQDLHCDFSTMNANKKNTPRRRSNSASVYNSTGHLS